MSEQKGTPFERVLQRAVTVAYWVGGLFLFSTMFFSTAEVIARYFFRRPIGWTFEIVEYILVAMTFLTCAYIHMRDGHLKVDIIVSRLKGKWQIVMNLLAEVFTFAFCLALAWATLRLTWDSVQLGLQSESAYQLPLAPYRLFVALGSLLLVLVCLVRIGRYTVKYLRWGSSSKGTQGEKVDQSG